MLNVPVTPNLLQTYSLPLTPEFLQHTDEILNSKTVLNIECKPNTNYLQHLSTNQNLPLALYLLVNTEKGCDPEVTAPYSCSCTRYSVPSVQVDNRKL